MGAIDASGVSNETRNNGRHAAARTTPDGVEDGRGRQVSRFTFECREITPDSPAVVNGAALAAPLALLGGGLDEGGRRGLDDVGRDDGGLGDGGIVGGLDHEGGGGLADGGRGGLGDGGLARLVDGGLGRLG